FTVLPGGVKEVAAELERKPERLERTIVVGARPASDTPRPEADLGDLPAEPSESPFLHRLPPTSEMTRVVVGSSRDERVDRPSDRVAMRRQTAGGRRHDFEPRMRDQRGPPVSGIDREEGNARAAS